MLQRIFPAGFISPCLPTKTDKLSSGDLWLHEIKHDGFRVIARKDGDRVRLYSRPGNDFTRRFPLIVEALARLRSRSCVIDGEAVACDDNGLASFERGAPHELMMLGSHPLTRKGYEVFIGVRQRELLDLFDGFTEIQENELPDKFVALVIREDGFDERFPAIAAKRAAAAKP